MLKQIFETQAIQYKTQAEMEAALGTFWIPDASYNAYLTTAPRIYGESLYSDVDEPLLLRGIAVMPFDSVAGETAIMLFATVAQTWFPGFNEWVFRWNGVSGEYIEQTLTFGRNDHDRTLFQSADGALWMLNLFSFYRLTLTTFLGDTTTTRDYSEFGFTSFTSLIVDLARDRIVIAGDNRKDIAVHEWASGAELSVVSLAAMPICITPEDSTRCYVLTDDDIIHLVDYGIGEVLSTIKVPVAGATLIAWDKYRRRLLVFARQADASDGSCQSTIIGYYPVPVATYLTTPIPLRPMRKGRTVPVLMRSVGDLGEPISGVVLNVSVSGDATLARSPAGTDSNGDALANVLCGDAGSADIDAAMENGL